MSWAHDYWPRERHEEILDLLRQAHGGELPAWARAADLVYLHDQAQHPTRPAPVPGRRELQVRWGVSERETKASLADEAWRSKAAAAKVRVVARPAPPRGGVPASVPEVPPSPSPRPSPSATDVPPQSAASVPAAVPASVPEVSPSPSPTRARSSHGPNGPTVLSGEGPPPPRPTADGRLTSAGLAQLAASEVPLERAAAEVAQRLLDAGKAPPSEWRTLPRDGQALAQRRVVLELARRAERAGVTPAELHEACSAYRSKWWPGADELLDLVCARRARLAAEDAARQLALEEADPSFEVALEPEPIRLTAPDPRPRVVVVEPPRLVGQAALEEARRRRQGRAQ